MHDFSSGDEPVLRTLVPFVGEECVSIGKAATIAGKSERTFGNWCVKNGIGRRIAGGAGSVSQIALAMLLEDDVDALVATTMTVVRMDVGSARPAAQSDDESTDVGGDSIPIAEFRHEPECAACLGPFTSAGRAVGHGRSDREGIRFDGCPLYYGAHEDRRRHKRLMGIGRLTTRIRERLNSRCSSSRRISPNSGRSRTRMLRLKLAPLIFTKNLVGRRS
jgi:hypothetical protein